MSWFEECYRKLFFDFHNHELVSGVASEFDAEVWADQLEEMGAQAVSVFTNDGFGWKYYRKGKMGYVHPQIPEGMDMVEETIKACRKRNIKVIGYYTPRRPTFFRELHPEYLIIDADGNAIMDVMNGLCKIGPVATQELLPQVEEITRHYDLDGIFYDVTYPVYPCYCNYCRNNFHKETGLKIPRDDKDPCWKTYLNWYFKKHAEFQKNMIDAAHRGNPEVMVADNWAYSYFKPNMLPKDTGFLSCDILPENQFFQASLAARNFALTGKPFDIMNTGFLKWWGEWGIKPDVALKQECATILANGGKTFIGYQLYPEHKVENAVTETFKEVFQFVKEREGICKNSRIEPYIGVFYSTINRGLTHGKELFPDMKAVYGIHKLFIDAGIHYNMLSDEFLPQKITDFKAVVLSDIRYMTDEAIIAVRKYVTDGGSLIVTGLSGTLDENYNPVGRCVIEDILGVKWEGLFSDSHAYMEIKDDKIKSGIRDMPIMLETQIALMKPESAKVLAFLRGLEKRTDGAFILRYSPPGEDTGYPFITVNNYGRGKVVYIAGDIFLGYYTGAQWNLVHLLKNIIKNLLDIERLVEIEGSSAVEVVLANKQGKKLVHLINCTGDIPATNVGEVCCITREVIPIYNFNVKVYLERQPSSVRMLPEEKVLDWKWDGNYLCTMVPKLDIHSCIEIEW